MRQRPYTIRRMRREELDIAIEWAAREGWNPGLYDVGCFWAADPRGFFVGLLGDEPVACISAVAYDDKFGFVGFYLVKPECRGKGYGIEVWRAAMSYLGSRNIGLDGVVEQQENYKKSGFKLAYRNIRYQGISRRSGRGAEIMDLSKVSLDQLVKYDAQLFPAERARFLQCWINQPQNVALGVMVKGKLRGYGVIRKCRRGYKIDPLFADDRSLADELFRGLSGKVKEGIPIFLDVPEVNPAAVVLARKYNMTKVFETARMYTKGEPEIDVAKVFGVTSFELG